MERGPDTVRSTLQWGPAMGIRLYDSVWVELEGFAEAFQVSRDRRDLAAFHAGDYQYDIDGRPNKSTVDAPKIIRLHSLQSARAAGLPTRYDVLSRIAS